MGCCECVPLSSTVCNNPGCCVLQGVPCAVHTLPYAAAGASGRHNGGELADLIDAGDTCA